MKSGIINIIANRNKDSQITMKRLRRILEQKGYTMSNEYDKSAELNICIGGDGAFLRAVHKTSFPTIPFVGINTGHLGFFQEIHKNDLESFAENYRKGAYDLEKIYLMECRVETKDRTFHLHSLNEFVVRNRSSQVVHLSVHIAERHLQNFSGDGLIISSSAGSTAYNYSAGGAILYPSLNGYQLTPLAPINTKAYRSLYNSIVIPNDTLLDIYPERRYQSTLLVISDGMELSFKQIRKLRFDIGERYIRRLVFDKNYYWTNLKDKFL